MNKFVNKPKTITVEKRSEYTQFNLYENPFPATPFMMLHSADKRVNGSIYEKDIRKDEYQQLKDKFLSKPQSDFSRSRLGFLMDTSFVGRGNGKTAFLMHLLKTNINNDYCHSISNEENKCFGLYIQPENGGKTKTFEKLVEKMIVEIINKNTLKNCIISIYLTAIMDLYPDICDDILKKMDELSDEECYIKITSSEWYRNFELDLNKIEEHIQENIYIKNLSNEFYSSIISKTQCSLFNNELSLTVDKVKNYLLNTLRKGDKIDFFFNDLVLLFEAANFNGAYIFIDDFERIPDFQSERDRRDFVNNLRTYLFDGNSENAKKGFYNFLLVLHAGVPRLIEKAWGESGMEQRCSLATIDKSQSEGHQIIFNPLNVHSTEKLIAAYIKEYSITQNSSNELFPFDVDAVNKIHSVSEGNVSKILKNCHNIIEAAVKEGNINLIDKNFVNSYFQKNEMINSNDDNFLNKAQVNLMDDMNE